MTASGEGILVRPGSWTGAKARDGSPEDLRDPIRVHMRKPELGATGGTKGLVRGMPPSPRKRREASTKQAGHVDCGSEAISDRGCTGGKS